MDPLEVAEPVVLVPFQSQFIPPIYVRVRCADFPLLASWLLTQRVNKQDYYYYYYYAERGLV
jgi:hypothetical protein